MGSVEEVDEAAARAQLDTNFFGSLWVTQVVLPCLRAQRSGHIVQISSIGGLTGFPTMGLYNASKWALEGMSEALAQEVARFGIGVTLAEPGSYATDWGGLSMQRAVRWTHTTLCAPNWPRCLWRRTCPTATRPMSQPRC